jgi:hypothetical protein
VSLPVRDDSVRDDISSWVVDVASDVFELLRLVVDCLSRDWLNIVFLDGIDGVVLLVLVDAIVEVVEVVSVDD